MRNLFGSTMLTTTLLVTSNLFMTFAFLYMGETLRWNYLWAGLCLMDADYFIFKG